MQGDSVILSAYREAVLAVHEKGLAGPAATITAVRAAAKIASHLLEREVTTDEVRRVLKE